MELDPAKQLSAAAAYREKTLWNSFYRKYEESSTQDDTSLSFDLSDNPLKTWENFEPSTVSITSKNLPEEEETLIKEIEQTLGSDLNKLILQAEKAKILDDVPTYKDFRLKVKSEIKRIRKYVSRQDLLRYIKLCLVSRADVEMFIEAILESTLKTLLLKKLTFLAENQTWINHEMHNKIVAEFDYLAKVLPEKDVILYAVSVLKKHKI